MNKLLIKRKLAKMFSVVQYYIVFVFQDFSEQTASLSSLNFCQFPEAGVEPAGGCTLSQLSTACASRVKGGGHSARTMEHTRSR